MVFMDKEFLMEPSVVSHGQPLRQGDMELGICDPILTRARCSGRPGYNILQQNLKVLRFKFSLMAFKPLVPLSCLGLRSWENHFQ